MYKLFSLAIQNGKTRIGIGSYTIRKLAVLDLSDNSRQIEEKLFTLLNEQQQSPSAVAPPFTEIQVGDLYFCLEERTVLVHGEKIDLTVREFDAFHLLITNRRQVTTFEMIIDHIWGYDYDSVENMLGAIHNIMSRIKQKLRVEPDIPDYITSVRGVGYKFNK